MKRTRRSTATVSAAPRTDPTSRGREDAPKARGALSDSEIATLTLIREEEKLARDVYSTLHQVWPAAVFSRVAASEQRHMDALLQLLTAYGIPDPAEGLPVGQFSDSDLQLLYEVLVETGSESKERAMQAAKFIEEVDREDLESAIQGTQHPELAQIYTHLRDSSIRHHAAFVHHLEDLQVTAKTP